MQCQKGSDTRTKKLKAFYVMPKYRDGKLCKAGIMRGEKCIVRKIQQSVGAVITALPASGVRQRALKITQEC
jgi:hypothetical protein